MTLILHTTALAVLMAWTVTSVQANETGLLLAESGSDRLMDYRLQQEALLSNNRSQDSGQRFARMLEEQPTAAGTVLEQKEQKEQQVGASETRFRSAILRDRALYGSPH
ncbi:hypothetical protein [Pseudomonas sp.]|uniref:hypothetical protein n=1 Tax=Pseudomonas sp. TaxID=306 RepID=UPI00299E35D4|nr:hypothetical protein [Pseudomonas sp.]MDX1369018.1 hypothetical protein [Pseudomonas sp.]